MIRPTRRNVSERLAKALGHVAPIAMPINALAHFTRPISHHENGVRLKSLLTFIAYAYSLASKTAYEVDEFGKLLLIEVAPVAEYMRHRLR